MRIWNDEILFRKPFFIPKIDPKSTREIRKDQHQYLPYNYCLRGGVSPSL